MRPRKPVRYGALAQAFHWVTAILVLIAFVYGPEEAESDLYRNPATFDRQFHETLGLLVFAMTAARLLWYLVDERPSVPDIRPWMHMASKAVQGSLYVLLFAVPCSAILGAWFEGHPLTLLGGIQIPPLVAASRSLGEGLAEAHTVLGDAIIWLAGVHAVAALFHHFILKDTVLVSMLPRWLKK
jgi:cytochrome b561